MHIFQSAKLLPAVLLFAVFLVGCDSTDALRKNKGNTATSQGVDAALQSATENFDLSSKQQRDLHDALAHYKDRRDEPGVLWRASADVQKILTDEQKAKLAEGVRKARARFADREHPKKHHRGKKHRPTERRFHALAKILTDEQREQARQLRQEQRATFKALREKRDELSDEDFRAQMKALRAKSRADFRALLTDEQKAELKEHRTKQKQRFEASKERREKAQAVRADVLALTGEQQQAFRQLHQEQRAAHKAMRERLHRRNDVDREAVRDALRKRRREQREQAAAIFNERQQAITMIHHVLAFRVMKRRARQP